MIHQKKKSTNIRIIVAHSLYARYGVSYFTYVDNSDSSSTKCILLFPFYKLKNWAQRSQTPCPKPQNW